MHLTGFILPRNWHVKWHHCLENARGGAPDLARKRNAVNGTRGARAPDFQAALLCCAFAKGEKREEC